MFHKLKRIWSPGIFQGYGKSSPYFEGWYYKLADNSGKSVYAIIPGVIFSENDSHCFIQILNGQTGGTSYHRFTLDRFWASKRHFELKIGTNIFRSDYLELGIHEEKEGIEAKIQIRDIVPWPVKLLSPGIMGWYAFVPFMECYHGVISMDHQLNGFLRIDENTIDLDAGRGYIEKDWGKSFPNAYIWMQCNHFDEPGISFTASIANIPWLRGSFRGFIIGLLYEGKLYRFATYTKASVRDVEVSDSLISFIVSDKNYLLKIEAERNSGGVLHAPLKSLKAHQMEMQQRVQQSLTGKIFVEFRETKKERLIYRGSGDHAGIEINGDIPSISDVLK
jgi:tocopherol cyclase